jgi:phage terminase small subunit
MVKLLEKGARVRESERAKAVQQNTDTTRRRTGPAAQTEQEYPIERELRDVRTDGARGPSQIDVTASHKKSALVHSMRMTVELRLRQWEFEQSRIPEV